MFTTRKRWLFPFSKVKHQLKAGWHQSPAVLIGSTQASERLTNKSNFISIAVKNRIRWGIRRKNGTAPKYGKYYLPLIFHTSYHSSDVKNNILVLQKQHCNMQQNYRNCIVFRRFERYRFWNNWCKKKKCNFKESNTVLIRRMVTQCVSQNLPIC